MTLPAPDTRLNRDDAAAALRAAGFHFSSATLATRACKGSGPPVERISDRPVYTWASTLAWAKADAASKAANREAANRSKAAA